MDTKFKFVTFENIAVTHILCPDHCSVLFLLQNVTNSPCKNHSHIAASLLLTTHLSKNP